jgi:hypothetical protein
MKIEGLGDAPIDRFIDEITQQNLNPQKLKIGQSIFDDNGDWIITDVLSDGKFKAIPKNSLSIPKTKLPENNPMFPHGIADHLKETFDISGKVDQSNPIYKFYESTLGKYVTNKLGAQRITDPQGVDWWQINIKPEHANPVQAFSKVAVPSALLKSFIDKTASVKQTFDLIKQPQVIGINNPIEKKVGFGGPIPEEYKFKIGVQADLTQNDPKFMNALFQTENPWWKADKVNPTGTDTGFGQHNAATVKDMKRLFNKDYNPKNPYQNIEMTAQWLNHIKKQIGTSDPKAVALAYHYGISAYNKKDPKVLNDVDQYWSKLSSNLQP